MFYECGVFHCVCTYTSEIRSLSPCVRVCVCVGLVEGGSKHGAAARCTILFTAPPQQINVTDPQTQLRNVYSPCPPSNPTRSSIWAGIATHVHESDHTQRRQTFIPEIRLRNH